MHFLIDADSAIYKAGCANEARSYIVYDEQGFIVYQSQYKADATEWVEEQEEGTYTIDRHKEAGPVTHALANIKGIMERIVEHRRCSSFSVFISGKNNFRYEIAEDYKGQRDPFQRPLQEKEIRDYLIKYWDAVVVDDIEVDDEVSILCMEDQENSVIVSIDKDLLNTPGWHYNYDKKEAVKVSLDTANLNFYRQMITGDRTDNITGIKGFGPKKALELLPDELPEEELCQVVWEAYKEKGYDKDYFIQQGRLLWMLREREVMWTPPIDLE